MEVKGILLPFPRDKNIDNKQQNLKNAKDDLPDSTSFPTKAKTNPFPLLMKG